MSIAAASGFVTRGYNMQHRRSQKSQLRRKLKSDFKKLFDMKSLWVGVNSQGNKAVDFETSEVDLLKGVFLHDLFSLPDGTVIKQGIHVLEWDDVEKRLVELGIVKLPQQREVNIIWIRNQQLNN